MIYQFGSLRYSKLRDSLRSCIPLHQNNGCTDFLPLPLQNSSWKLFLRPCSLGCSPPYARNGTTHDSWFVRFLSRQYHKQKKNFFFLTESIWDDGCLLTQ